MSAKSEELEGEGAEDEVCASCGITAVDDIKLKECNDCQSVTYCSDKCREDHREQHGGRVQKSEG